MYKVDCIKSTWARGGSHTTPRRPSPRARRASNGGRARARTAYLSPLSPRCRTTPWPSATSVPRVVHTCYRHAARSVLAPGQVCGARPHHTAHAHAKSPRWPRARVEHPHHTQLSLSLEIPLAPFHTPHPGRPPRAPPCPVARVWPARPGQRRHPHPSGRAAGSPSHPSSSSATRCPSIATAGAPLSWAPYAGGPQSRRSPPRLRWRP